MFAKHPIAIEIYAELCKLHPHRKWRYALLCLALAVSIAFLIQGEITDNYRNVYSVVLFVVLIYWFFQFQMMNAAVKLSISDTTHNIPQSTSQIGLAPARIKAILWHYRYHLVLLLIAMFAATLSLTDYLHYYHQGTFNPFPLMEKRGILRYIGAIQTGEISTIRYGPLLLIHALPIMMIFNLSSSILSISIGLWAKRLTRARLTAIMIIGVALLAFFILFGIRNTEPFNCNRYWGSSHCQAVLLKMRLLDSFQSMAFTFIDGGITSSSGLAGVSHYCWWQPHHVRQLLSTMSTLSIQILLIFTFLGNSCFTKLKRKQ